MLYCQGMIRKNTKIVATLGPASESEDKISALMDAGVNVFRLNFSHGDHETFAVWIERIRRLAEEKGKMVAILQDLGGPKIRTGDLVGGEAILEKNSELILTTKKQEGNAEKMSISYPELPQDVQDGDTILLDDGKINLKVIETNDEEIKCQVMVGGVIKSRRGINVPGVKLSIAAMTEKDKEDLKFGIAHGVDFVGLSFVHNASDISHLRNLLIAGESQAKIVAKIETAEAVKNIDEIIAETDAIMVARGDLAVEIPAYEVPIVQKSLVRKCRELAKPVIVATQMLESMVSSPVATRAEVSDVANAVFDGADAVMLSGEVATGSYPLEAVKTMAQVAIRVESESMAHSFDVSVFTADNDTDAIAAAVMKLSQHSDTKAVVVFTESGATARQMSRFRPREAIFGLTANPVTARQLALSYGVVPVVIEHLHSVGDVVEEVPKIMRGRGLLQPGDKLVATAGINFGVSGSTDMLVVLNV